jgi:hypothetical protein
MGTGRTTGPRGQEMLFPFVEREYLALASADPEDPALHQRLFTLARIAVLFSEGTVLIPAPGLFETAAGYRLACEFSPAIEQGAIAFLGGGPSPTSFVERKNEQFTGEAGACYADGAPRRVALARQSWRVKGSSTDADLLTVWTASNEAHNNPLLTIVGRRAAPASATAAIETLPATLEGRAFVTDNLIARLPRDVQRAVLPREREAVRFFLAAAFYASYTSNSVGTVLTTTGLPDVHALLPANVQRLPCPSFIRMLRWVGLEAPLLRDLTVEQLLRVADSSAWRAFAAGIRERASRGEEWNRRDVLSLARVRKPRGRAARKTASIDGYLVMLLTALETSGRRPGDTTGNVNIRRATVGQIVQHNAHAGAADADDLGLVG